jgi:hypothetical protein
VKPPDERPDVVKKPTTNAPAELAGDHAGPFHIGMPIDQASNVPGYSLPVDEPALVLCGGHSPVPTMEVLAHRGGTYETLRLQLTADETRIAIIQFEPPCDLQTAEGIGVRDTARSVAKAYGTPARELPRAFVHGPFCASFAAHPGLAFCFASTGWDDALSRNAPVSAICVRGD